MRTLGLSTAAVLAIFIAVPARAQLPPVAGPSAGVEAPSLTPVPVPSLPVPSVPVPSVPVPSVPVPSLPTPTVPVPSLPAPSLTPTAPAQGPRATAPSTSGAPAAAPTGDGVTRSGSDVAVGTSSARSGRGASAPGQTSADGPRTAGRSAAARQSTDLATRVRAERRTIRRLRRAIARYSGCLALLPPRQRRVLRLRAGFGPADPLSRTRVAARLDLSRAAVRRAERRGLRALRRAGRQGCPAASRSMPEDIAAVLSASSPPVPERILASVESERDGGAHGGDSESGGGGAESGGAGRQGVRGGVAGISATRPTPEAGALHVLGPLLLALLALAAALAVLHARRQGAWSPWARWVAPSAPIVAATAIAPEREQQRPASPAAPAPGPPPSPPEPSVRLSPPDPRRPWIAAVRRSETGLAVVARSAADEPGVILATSGSVERLEAALLAGGWQPVPAGGASSTKRFAWTVAAPERSEAWPAETDDLWRCEIEWQPGYRSSSFRAVMYGPARRRGATIGNSNVFKWLLMGDPDPRDEWHVEEVRRIAERLRGAGWEPVGRGRQWYSLRFAWRRDEPPPERLDPAPDEDGR